ncbi:MAG: MASE1 domain-containing protein [Brevundimonas sp.]|nr:MASE1 domain-containing protein [Brevundimonas sp.]
MPVSPALDIAKPAKPVSVRGTVRPVTERVHEPVFAQPLVPILTAVGVALLIVVAVTFARTAGLIAALWGAGGLATVVWLRTSRGPIYDLAYGGLIVLGILAGQFLVGNPPLLSVMFTVANMMEIVLAVTLARRFAPGLNLSTVEGCARFLLSAAVVAPIPAALFASMCLYAMNGADIAASFQTWWFGHALGLAVFGTFGLALTRTHLRVLRQPWKLVEAILLLGLLAGASWVVFWLATVPMSFVVIPLLILVAVRLRVLGISVALLIVTLSSVGGAMLGYGAYAQTLSEVADRAMLAQVMILLGCLPILLVAALLEERDLLADRARAGQVRAERASAAKSRLLANVAHEIKSPVGGVIGIGELWKSGQIGAVTDTQREMADMLVKTARQVEALAHDLLDVARAESGAIKVDLRPTDVHGVLEDVARVTALRPDAAAVRIELECAVDGMVVLADSQRLTQVISNLASNAVKYGGSGGVVILKASRVTGGVRIEVIDQGPGLSPEKQTQLFEPFNRLGLERSAIEGHGIGLALAKRLVELQRGDIGVVSEPGQGATFWVELQAA